MPQFDGATVMIANPMEGIHLDSDQHLILSRMLGFSFSSFLQECCDNTTQANPYVKISIEFLGEIIYA